MIIRQEHKSYKISEKYCQIKYGIAGASHPLQTLTSIVRPRTTIYFMSESTEGQYKMNNRTFVITVRQLSVRHTCGSSV